MNTWGGCGNTICHPTFTAHRATTAIRTHSLLSHAVPTLQLFFVHKGFQKIVHKQSMHNVPGFKSHRRIQFKTITYRLLFGTHPILRAQVDAGAPDHGTVAREDTVPFEPSVDEIRTPAPGLNFSYIGVRRRSQTKIITKLQVLVFRIDWLFLHLSSVFISLSLTQFSAIFSPINCVLNCKIKSSTIFL